MSLYAIVKTGGKQYRVEQGQELLVEKLDAEAGASVSLEPVLVKGDAVAIGADALKSATVGATVVEHVKGPKIRIFKFKPKRGYKRTTGHRQPLTKIRIDSISA
ncbi:50S ribosomal protein L21 [Patulibacter brassicae]|jgi:large subunit ribosomal protein L21|uniref:Large ribosomal subunit protein bL21 n=1 Tax=Patulibacter brassicae TaxID=1705717 RepID=A0ABU4VI71_9ACTN|nr:50S ribosomal protein L21 [Patulibacter brassicae]MDX8150844.1 50S ribosomal protein L21 [Patulibacter brassicae]